MKNNQEGQKKILAILTIVILVVLIGHVISVFSFNSKVHTVKGPDDKQASYLNIANRDDSTSSWVKADYDLYGKKVDLNANTIDGTFYNNYPEDITSWKLRINIKGDCFINNAWCGTVEIHQFVGTKNEAVQTLDLRNYKLEDVKLKNLYDGDLLIPLKKGDYIVYHPSEKDDEIPITSKSELTIGTIFYYLNDLDLSDYQVSFKYHKPLTEGIGFYATIILLLLWLIIFVMIQVARVSYKKALDQLEIRMSGIKYMSDIYDIIYIIDLDKNELIPLTADDESEKLRPKNMSARDQLLNLFLYDADDSYLDLMQEFADINTLDERLSKESIVCNYLSKTHGWSQIRFFAMDREEGAPLSRVLFTIQNIDEEKNDLEQNEQRISKSEEEKKVKSIFFDILADRVRTSVDTMHYSSSEISTGSSDGSIRKHADIIYKESDSLMQMAEKLKNASEIYAGTLKLEPVDYHFKNLMQDVHQEAVRAIGDKAIAFHADISPQIPGKLHGDPNRIRQVMAYLLANSVEHTSSGSVSVSIFGNQKDDKEHLLISIKDTGSGIGEENLKRLTEHWSEQNESWNFSREEPGIGLTMIHEMLNLMGSGLHIISGSENGSEFYFEIEQTIVDPAPVGPIEF